jgi:single-stranded-DNA-specific exonuclease
VGKLSSKASCRSVPGVHITNLLRLVKDDLMEVGGHPMAAGFRVETAKIGILKEHLSALTKIEIKQQLLHPSIEVECVIPASFVSIDTVLAINLLEPFGVGNREAVFALHDLRVIDKTVVGKDGRHLKLKVSPETAKEAKRIDAIGFGMAALGDSFVVGQTISVAALISANEWKGKVSPQLILKDVHT